MDKIVNQNKLEDFFYRPLKRPASARLLWKLSSNMCEPSSSGAALQSEKLSVTVSVLLSMSTISARGSERNTSGSPVFSCSSLQENLNWYSAPEARELLINLNFFTRCSPFHFNFRKPFSNPTTVSTLCLLCSGQGFPTPVSPQYRTCLPTKSGSKWVTRGPPRQSFPAQHSENKR